MTKKKSLMGGAFVLSVAGLVGKVMAAFYRIPFTRVVGDEGAGLYALSYSLYNILFALSTAGIPLAVSKMVAYAEEAGKRGESLRIFKVTLGLLSFLGLVLAVSVFLGAESLALLLFNEPRAALSLKALAPAMFFSCLMSAFRGFFQGQREMVPTALSQILEQFFRVGVILLAIFFLAGYPLEVVVASASFGSSVGQMVAFAFLALLFLWTLARSSPKTHNLASTVTNGDIAKDLFRLAIPISIGALALPILGFVDSTISLHRLETAGGFSHTQAIIENGYLVNSSMPILNLLFIITTAISAALVPAVTEADARGDQAAMQGDIHATLMLTVIIMLPAGLGLFLLGAPITQLLYDQWQAGVAMQSVAFVVLALGLYQVSAGALQGLGQVMIPMQSLGMALVVKLVLVWTLCGIPGFGIKGAGIATVAAFTLAAVHNLLRLTLLIGSRWFNLKTMILKPFVASAVMGIIVSLVYGASVTFLGSDSLGVLLSVAFGGLSYFVALYFIGGISPQVLAKVPKVGPKLARRFQVEGGQDG